MDCENVTLAAGPFVFFVAFVVNLIPSFQGCAWEQAA